MWPGIFYKFFFGHNKIKYPEGKNNYVMYICRDLNPSVFGKAI